MKFSIVTVVRNDAPGLQLTARSVQEQAFKDHEWIVVVGRSTDGTEELAQSFQGPGVQVSIGKDTGIFDAMNKGLRASTGDYVVFMNAGDTFASAGTLATVNQAIEAQAAPDLIYGDSIEKLAGNQASIKQARPHHKISYGMFACHQSVYYKGALARSQSYNDALRVSGDYAFTAAFLQKAAKVVAIAEPLCVFDRSGVSNTNKAAGRRENWAVQRDVLRLSWFKRAANRLMYLLSAFLADHMAPVYKLIRSSGHAR
jgi:putative colanic acid biosynthesis glycosyltransferase